MVTQEERPVDFIQPGAIDNPDDAVGLVAAAPIKKGEQILMTKLLTPGPNTGLSLQVAPDKRAVAIPVDQVRGVWKTNSGPAIGSTSLPVLLTAMERSKA